MEPIRLKKRECRDQAKIQELLATARIGIVAMNAGDYPYAVPVNYVWLRDAIYFHGAGAGKKFDLLANGAKVCFTAYTEFGTSTGDVACHVDTSYRSVMVFGRAEKITDYALAAESVQALMTKYTPGRYEKAITPELLEKYRTSVDHTRVAVFRIVPEQITAKEKIVDPEKLLSPDTQNGK